jgi:hypothetical protein
MMSTDELLKEISSAQVTAGEAAVIASLERIGSLKRPAWVKRKRVWFY